MTLDDAIAALYVRSAGSKACVRDAPKGRELASLISTQRSVRRWTEAGTSKGQEEALQSSRIAVDALARLHIFNLNYSGAPPAHSVDGVHAKPAVANEP
jgi:hypothetical protein